MKRSGRLAPLQEETKADPPKPGQRAVAKDGDGLQDFGNSGTGLRKTPSQVHLAAETSENYLLRRLSPAMHATTGFQRSKSPFGSMPTTPLDGMASPRVALEQAAPASPLLSLATIMLRQGAKAVVDDSFTRCFDNTPSLPWNWNLYLYPAWLLGIVIRYLILFPLRLFGLLLGFLLFIIFFFPLKSCRCTSRRKWERTLVQFLCSVFVMSWSGVVKLHGTRPKPRKGQPQGVFVANHSSMIDFVLLQQSATYAVVGQQHQGWVRFFQDQILSCLDCVWFNRGESKNRQQVARKLQDHANDPDKNPLLVFPEGTCVNNKFVVQFKKGVFDLGVPINPIAIRYDLSFAPAYWNSRKISFAGHLFSLMTSWCVVVDIWFLDPMTQRPEETAVTFAKRVQLAIAKKSGLKAVDWDGYMKYWAPSERFIKARKKSCAQHLIDTAGLRPASPATTVMASLRNRKPTLTRSVSTLH